MVVTSTQFKMSSNGYLKLLRDLRLVVRQTARNMKRKENNGKVKYSTEWTCDDICHQPSANEEWVKKSFEWGGWLAGGAPGGERSCWASALHCVSGGDRRELLLASAFARGLCGASLRTLWHTPPPYLLLSAFFKTYQVKDSPIGW